MGSVPLAALSINQQQPNPLEQYGKALQLKSLLAQQAMQPGQQQLQQQQIQGNSLELQMKQLELQNRQIGQSALSDPKFSKEFSDWQSSKQQSGGSNQAPAQGAATPGAQTQAGGSAVATGTVPLHPLAQFLADKKGLPLIGPGGALELSGTLTASAEKMAQLAKTQGDIGKTALENHQKQLDNFDNIVEPVLAEKDPTKQQAGLQNIQSEISTHPELYPPEATQHLGTMNTIQGLQTAANTSKVRQMLVDDASKAAKASQEVTAASAPTAQQIKTATDSLKSFSALPTSLRNSLATEIQNAPDFETLQKIQSRAETQQNSNQMHLDSLASTRAIQGNKFGEAGLTANEKMWTDPQRGFAGALAQANQTKASIVAGADGNALLTNMVPTMEVLGINHAAGISRISPAEATAAGTSPDWATRWNAWATKVTTGKLTPELAKEGNQLMDIVTDAAHSRAVMSANLIAKGHGLDPSQVPAMNRDGSLTTLDKLSSKGGSSPSGTQGSGAIPQPSGATHKVLNKADGKMHWTDEQNSKDMGVAE
jgi:hypothetical protein